MALDKYLVVPAGSDWPELHLKEADIEFAIIKLFLIDISRLIELKATLSKNFHIQPSEIDRMPYWEYEFYLEALNKQVQEENEKQQAEMDKYGIKEHLDAARPSNMKKMMSSAQPKMPAMPNFGSMKAPSMKF